MKKLWYGTILSWLCFLLAFSGVTAEAASAQVDNLRISTAQDKVRIVADTSGEVDYRSFMLKEPQRVVVELMGATLGDTIQREYLVNAPQLKKIRVAQFNDDTVRIVLETNIVDKGYDIFSLPGVNSGYRVVMDLGKAAGNEKVNIKKDIKPAPVVKKPEAKQESKKVDIKPIIVQKPTVPVALPAIDFKITDKDKEILKGKKITIDPGHGGSDSGAVGSAGVMEKNVSFKVGMTLAKLLKESGARVFLTRKGDNDVAPQPATDVEELQARVDVANNSDSDAFVSIHLDSFTKPTAQGTSGWYYEKASERSKFLADSIKRHVVQQLGTVDRGTRYSNFYVVKHTNMPATLVELGFLSNPKEEAMLNSDDGVRKAAIGIYQGFVEFFATK